jgi:predicted DCC family thiol-disulfide oxidoreductase YuxK
MTNAERTQITGRTILLYDGICVLCNRTVQFLLRHDRDATLLFAPIESSLGQELLTRFNAQDGPEGVVLITNTLTPVERLYRRSDAFNEILPLLNDPWPAIGRILRLIPHPLRELGYSIVARIRYRIFGRYDTCPLPTPHERNKIIGVYRSED